MTVHMIANPSAGRGRAAATLPAVEHLFDEAGIDLEIHPTRAPWHAADIAEALCLAGHDTVVSLGGDGTTNEVVHGLLRAAAAVGRDGVAGNLGIIPAGSGNDAAYPFGLHSSVEAACRAIFRGHTRIIDVGQVQADDQAPRYFVNGVGVGFDAVINVQSRRFRRLRGASIYLAALLLTVAVYYSAPRVRVTCDGHTFDGESLMLSIMNGRRLGGTFYVTPEAAVDDGLFDLLLTRKMSRLGILGMIPLFLRGTHLRKSEVVQLARARQIEVDIEGTMPSHVDGEIYGVESHHYEFSILPGRLQVFQ